MSEPVKKQIERERDRIIGVIEREAEKLEEEGSPTAAMIVRDLIEKIRRGK